MFCFSYPVPVSGGGGGLGRGCYISNPLAGRFLRRGGGYRRGLALGMYSCKCMVAILRPSTLARLQCRDGARRVLGLFIEPSSTRVSSGPGGEGGGERGTFSNPLAV